MSFICIIIKNHFHVIGFALSLALKVRFFELGNALLISIVIMIIHLWQAVLWYYVLAVPFGQNTFLKANIVIKFFFSSNFIHTE